MCKTNSFYYEYPVYISKQFYFKQFSLVYVASLFLFDPRIRPYQVLPLRVRVDLAAMAMNKCSAFPKGLLEPRHQIV